MARPNPFPTHNSFIVPIAARDYTTRPVASSAKSAVDAGVPPAFASGPLVVSPPSTTGATVTAPSKLIHSRTHHRPVGKSVTYGERDTVLMRPWSGETGQEVV